MLFRRIERSLHIDCCLNQYGQVMASANGHTVMAGFEGVATGIMSVVMSGNRDNVPHILNVADPATEENYKLLCIIAGRKSLCLQCKQEGHYRRDCVTPFCRHHNDFVHAPRHVRQQKVTRRPSSETCRTQSMTWSKRRPLQRR